MTFYSQDSKFFYQVYASSLHKVALSTQLQVHSFNHDTDIVSAFLDPFMKNQLIVCTKDFKIFFWKDEEEKPWKEGSLFGAQKTARGLLLSVLPDRFAREVFHVLVQQKQSVKTFTCDIARATTSIRFTLQTGKHNAPALLAASAPGNLLACAYGKQICVTGVQKDIHVPKGSANCVALSPDETMIAIGSNCGLIFLYMLADLQTGKSRHQVLEWHSSAVSALVFSWDSNQLLSGASEQKVVMWNTKTLVKGHLGHLSSSISNIACSYDFNKFMVTEVNGTVTTFDAYTQHVKEVVSGFAKISQEELRCAVAVIEPKRGLVALNHLGSLQFCDPKTGRIVSELEVIDRSRLRNFLNHKIKRAIKFASFSSCGSHLVTYDEMKSKKLLGEPHLQFWMLQKDSAHHMFKLNTYVNSPHEKGVTGISFSPTAEAVVTTSFDGKFKLWTLENNTHWQATAMGHYRDLPSTCSAFSHDGSLLAVAFHNTLTLWNPKSNTLKNSLWNPDSIDHSIIQTGFIVQQPLVVVVTRLDITVWNLLSLSVLWSFQHKMVTPHRVAFSNNFPHFAITHQDRFATWLTEFSAQNQDVCSLKMISKKEQSFIPLYSSINSEEEEELQARKTKKESKDILLAFDGTSFLSGLAKTTGMDATESQTPQNKQTKIATEESMEIEGDQDAEETGKTTTTTVKARKTLSELMGQEAVRSSGFAKSETRQQQHEQQSLSESYAKVSSAEVNLFSPSSHLISSLENLSLSFFDQILRRNTNITSTSTSTSQNMDQSEHEALGQDKKRRPREAEDHTSLSNQQIKKDGGAVAQKNLQALKLTTDPSNYSFVDDVFSQATF